MNEKLATAKKFVVKHKTAIAVTVTAIAVNRFYATAINQHNDFLKEHGLYEQFYTPENSY